MVLIEYYPSIETRNANCQLKSNRNQHVKLSYVHIFPPEVRNGCQKNNNLLKFPVSKSQCLKNESSSMQIKVLYSLFDRHLLLDICRDGPIYIFVLKMILNIFDIVELLSIIDQTFQQNNMIYVLLLYMYMYMYNIHILYIYDTPMNCFKNVHNLVYSRIRCIFEILI